MTSMLEAIAKGQKKAAKKGKKRKRNYRDDSSSSSSDSEQEIGSGDTGLSRDKRLKIDKPLGSNFLSTTARPIKVTNLTQGGTYVPRDSEDTVIRKNTGKVTAVVAVMTVSSRNLRNSQVKTKTGQFKTKTANKLAILTETRSKSN